MQKSASKTSKALSNLMMRAWWIGLMILLAHPVVGHANVGGRGWETRQIEGREYVSTESIMHFYQLPQATRSGRTLVLDHPQERRVQMRLEVGGHVCLMNNLKFVFSHPIVQHEGKVWVSKMDVAKLIDPVLRPNFIPNAGAFNTVILDPGHGGRDPGAQNRLGTEAFYNLKLAGMTKRKLEAGGFRVVMTRSSDRFLSLQERVDLANSVRENAIFICIHFNAGGSHARGIETFTLSPPGVAHYGRGVRADDQRARPGNQQDSANIALATAIQGRVLTHLRSKNVDTFDRGIKRARFSVLSGVRHPAVLFEGGFMSNPQEAQLIHSNAYQDHLATAIADAVMVYRAAVTRGATAPARRR